MSFTAIEVLESRCLFAAVPAAEHVFLIGNSMTDAIRYAGLVNLLSRDGRAVTLGRQTGPGYSIADNLNLKPGYYTSGLDPTHKTEADLFGNYQQAFAAHAWDDLSLQPSDHRILVDNRPAPGGGTRNDADVPMAMEFLHRFAVNSPSGQVFIYSRPVRRTDIDEGGKPTGKVFDYSAEWLKPYIETGIGTNFNVISRSFTTQYMTQLRNAEKTDAATKNLKPARLIPVAEAFYNIDQMIKAGKFAGTSIKSITDFYIDGSHPRKETGAYLTALTFYSSLTGHDPRGLAPPGNYLSAPVPADAAKIQSLIQQAVYDAMIYSGYTAWTTPIGAVQPPPPPPPTGSISGRLFSDDNANAKLDAGEALLPNRVVFIDLDNDGVLDANEKRTTTDSLGHFHFDNLAAGVYSIRRVLPAGYHVSTPPVKITLAAGQSFSTVLIGAAKN